MRYRNGSGLVALAIGLVVAFPAVAQNYPGSNINFIVPYPPGGGTDIPARIVVDKLMEQTGWNVVVLNQPGAGGTIGLDQLARSNPDGLTIGMAQTSNLAVNPALNPEVNYDPLTDFTLLGLVTTQPMGIVTHNGSPFETFQDFIDEVRENPGSVLFGTPGTGTVAHMSIERLAVQGDLELEHVPYTGIAQAISDVMAGVVDIYIGSVPSVLPHVTSGSLRALAVTSAQPDPLLPDVPTVASFGFEGYESSDWKALVGPAGMPEDVLASLNAAIAAAMSDPELRSLLEAQGSTVLSGDPEEFAAFLPSEVQTWAEVVDAIDIQID
ncbi:tripartite tricarboxylate transporter substrate binding protein [Arsenicitalea aurantiaca]|uniref:Tripartite tricarboxylate transporter substrate binding protein n=1 Tax=Arsenicitalea aurantiaca TaxID=1783274 RepID=A0A433X2R4_9HYPH|nr:tripartite tricarboxylate transporter substrate binding protein [Arsenicitalea aurantiaca]RUT28302.1 tripartite tricarboxylate transporter substrate binding protein [Arsenicitalea aurantiaca]